MIKKNLAIIAVVAVLYMLNQAVKGQISGPLLAAFMSGYFNDIICGAGFMAYCNIFIELWKRPLRKILAIEAVLLCAGLVWEYVTPILVKGSVSDLWDIAAYMLGGVIYWCIMFKWTPAKENQC